MIELMNAYDALEIKLLAGFITFLVGAVFANILVDQARDRRRAAQIKEEKGRDE